MNVFTRINIALLILIPMCLIVGHVNDGALDWKVNQISTYAAKAPHDNWITAGMAISVLLLLSMSIVVQNLIPNRWIGTCISQIYAISAGGLLLLTIKEETVSGTSNLMKNGKLSYQQGFHDGGLGLFCAGAILALVLTGAVLVCIEKSWRRVVAGMLLLTPFGVVGSLIQINTDEVGLYQRAAFFCLWMGCFFLTILQNNQLSSNS